MKLLKVVYSGLKCFGFFFSRVSVCRLVFSVDSWLGWCVCCSV